MLIYSLFIYLFIHMFYIYCYKMYFDQTWLGGPVSNVGGPVQPSPLLATCLPATELSLLYGEVCFSFIRVTFVCLDVDKQ